MHSDDKKRARLNCISRLFSLIPYKAPQLEEVKLGRRNLKDKYDGEAALKGRRFIPAIYCASMADGYRFSRRLTVADRLMRRQLSVTPQNSFLYYTGQRPADWQRFDVITRFNNEKPRLPSDTTPGF